MLDIGCGTMPYRNLFPEKCTYIGIDTFESEKNFGYKQDNVIYYDGMTFPLQDNFVSVVLHSEVMEHIYDTKNFISECHRVLIKGGYMLVSVPFQAKYHYIPYDYWRFTPSSLENILTKAGFSNIRILPRGTDVTVAGYKVLAIGYRLFFNKSWFKKLLSVILAPIWVLGLIAARISVVTNIGSEDDCLGFVIYCKKD